MPYIPKQHAKYGLLPYCREHGGEVFSYPGLLNEVDDKLIKIRQPNLAEGEVPASVIMPYGFDSYEEYYSLLGRLEEECEDEQLVTSIENLLVIMQAMNVKEDWSVVRFIGDQETGMTGLTKGRYYYWPCRKDMPKYEGVVDDEEFTSYLYPCDPDAWEIAEDPTGMAARALAGDNDSVSFWKLEPTGYRGMGPSPIGR